jgi:hypothetical protein
MTHCKPLGQVGITTCRMWCIPLHRAL